jgi:hypothetical protein
MKISVEKIFQFHRLRTQTHIDCLNYYAGLLGYHFPEHDNDKNHDTICTGYAYYNWAKYHPEYTMSPAHRELFELAKHEHHTHQPHHVWYYENTADIDDVTLIEIICDWHSASFEQRFITHEDPLDYDVRTFFEKNLMVNPKLHWTTHQIELINSTIDFLEMYAEHDTILKIWLPLLDY